MVVNNLLHPSPTRSGLWMEGPTSNSSAAMPFQQKARAFDILVDPDQDKAAVLKDVIHDCALAFNCRAIESEDENYSTGCTYFIRGNETPKTGLEELAQQIFKLHSRGKTFNPALSGAEWWTQVIDERDDIGVHWDRDYGMEEETGTHVYPFFATVSYFAEKGSPTVIWDKEGTIDHSFEIVGNCKAMEFSRPQMWKHIAFPGNLLHAAPSVIMFGDEEDDEQEEEEAEGSGEEETTDDGITGGDKKVTPIPRLTSEENLKTLLRDIESKRITFLVNIWFNHIPSQSVRCDDELFPLFKSPAGMNSFRLQPSAITAAPRPLYPIVDEECTRKVVLKFVANDVKYDVVMPLPSTQQLWGVLDKDPMAGMQYNGQSAMTISYSSDQEDSDEEGEYDEDEGEEEEEDGEEGDEEHTGDDDSAGEGEVTAKKAATDTSRMKRQATRGGEAEASPETAKSKRCKRV